MRRQFEGPIFLPYIFLPFSFSGLGTHVLKAPLRYRRTPTRDNDYWPSAINSNMVSPMAWPMRLNQMALPM